MHHSLIPFAQSEALIDANLIVFVFPDVPLRNLVVLANSVAELPCDTVPADRHDEVILVLWFRENVGTPIFRQVNVRVSFDGPVTFHFMLVMLRVARHSVQFAAAQHPNW